MNKGRCHLLDVNVLIAILHDKHIHHIRATKWFDTPGLQWALCPITETGFVRYAMQPSGPNMSMTDSTALLAKLMELPGYHHVSAALDWQTVAKLFSKRLHGPKQVTDAYLLGLAIHNTCVLVTFDHGLEYLAGELSQHLLLLKDNSMKLASPKLLPLAPAEEQFLRELSPRLGYNNQVSLHFHSQLDETTYCGVFGGENKGQEGGSTYHWFIWKRGKTSHVSDTPYGDVSEAFQAIPKQTIKKEHK